MYKNNSYKVICAFIGKSKFFQNEIKNKGTINFSNKIYYICFYNSFLHFKNNPEKLNESLEKLSLLEKEIIKQSLKKVLGSKKNIKEFLLFVCNFLYMARERDIITLMSRG